MSGSLVKAFDEAMHDVYRDAIRYCNYSANIFRQMLDDRGGVATAKFLLNKSDPSDGFSRLWECGRLDLTVEAVVLDNDRWHCLFTEEELKTARFRLTELGYFDQNGRE